MLEVTKHGAVWMLTSDQSINADCVADLEQRIEPCFAAGQPKLVLSLQHVPLIDSAGLEWIWNTRHRCDACGGGLELAAPSALCREILVATRLSNHFVIFDDVVAAAGSFAQ